jgi:hypothetical protein
MNDPSEVRTGHSRNEEQLHSRNSGTLRLCLVIV